MKNTNTLSINIFLELGVKVGFYDYSPSYSELPLFIKHLWKIGFKPFEDRLLRSRISRGYNFKLSLLHELLVFLDIRMHCKASKFKFSYFEQDIASEFKITSTYLKHIEANSPKEYQHLCDLFAECARNGRTTKQVMQKMSLFELNPSQQILFSVVDSLYRSGSSRTGLLSISSKLNKDGYKGYKTSNSISKSFSNDIAHIKAIEDIMSAYELSFYFLYTSEEEDNEICRHGSISDILKGKVCEG